MKVRDLMSADGRVYLKSEWGPISDYWPCVSFSKKSVATRLSAFQSGIDILVYVGTTSPDSTEDPLHRSRLLSAVVVQPGQVLSTKEIIPPEAWQESVHHWGENRWVHAMAVTRAAVMAGPPFPDAREVIPTAYSQIGWIENRGNLVEAVGAEREAVMDLDIEEIKLNLRPGVRAYLEMRSAIASTVDKALRDEITRMALLIQQRVGRSGEPGVRINPLRSAPNISDLMPLLTRKWHRQLGHCALCHGRIPAGTKNQMLQPSADRIDSANGAYDDANVQITHLSCNLAKNKYGVDDFAEWLDVIRSQDEAEPSSDLR